MRTIYTILIFILFLSCNSNKTQDKANNTANDSISIEQAKKKSFEAELTEYEHQQNKVLEKLKDSCGCVDYQFSESGKKPIIEYQLKNYHFIICGYSGYNRNDTITIGQVLEDGSVFLSGFEIFECENYSKSFISGGEYHIHRIIPRADRLSVERYIFIQNGENWKSQLSPVISFNIYLVDNVMVMDTTFVLDVSKIQKKLVKKHMDLLTSGGKDTLYQLHESPETIMGKTFISAIIEYPKYSKEFKEIGPFDGYGGPLYNYMLEYFEIFEEKNLQ